MKRFQEAGLEERLKEKSQLVREERVLTTAGERLDPVRSVHEELVGVLPIDTAFSSTKAVEGLPNAELLQQAEGILNRLTERLRLAAQQISGEITAAEQELSALRTAWNQRKASVEARYESLLRELQKSKIDGEEFIRLIAKSIDPQRQDGLVQSGGRLGQRDCICQGASCRSA